MKWFFLMLFPVHAFAQGTYVTPQERIPASDKKELGWVHHANVGANLSYSSSNGVVGQTDGSTQTYGLNFKGSINQINQHTEWRNNLNILEATTSTASLPRFVKSNDDAKYETAFLYSLPSFPEVGPYAQGSVETNLFMGEDVRTTDTTYGIHYKSGSSRTVTGTSLRLTDGLKPLTTRESTGFFYRPIDRPEVKLEARLGLGAMQIMANGQFSVQGNDAQGNVNVQELSDVDQLGVEAGITVSGKINDHADYSAGVSALTPFVLNRASDDSRSDFELTNVEGSAKLTSKITKWAAFSYDYRLKIEPQLVTQAQQTHLLVLTLNYDLL